MAKDKDELTIRYKELQKQIQEQQQNGEDITVLLREKIDLLTQYYHRLSDALQDKKYEKNPRKYSTLVSYLNTIKKIQIELNESTQETEKEILSVETEMRNAGLGWILDADVRRIK